jgi:hypothetical protein
MSSGDVPIVRGGGRSASEPAGVDDNMVRVAIMTPAGSRLSGIYRPEAGADGRAPTGGWPTKWTRVTNDSNNHGQDFQDIDIYNLSMMDNSNHIYFKIGLQNLSTLYVNDEWNFYFMANDNATNNSRDMWYRLTLRVTNATAPTFTSTLYSYSGGNYPPDRGDFTTVNETHSGTGNSTDGTMYGYWFDKTNNSVLFYVVKSQLYGNLLGPRNTTMVYADTWWVDDHNRWRNYDRAPNGSRLGSYTMIPEFQDMLVPVVGSVLVFIFLRRAASGSKRSTKGARVHRQIIRCSCQKKKEVSI